MLSLIYDCRSGKKIEIIIPTFNEQLNLKRLINAYNDIADIVILDDNSTDDTISYAIQNKCTVYKRDRNLEPTKFAPTEYSVYYYSEHLSLSNKIIKLDADEMITYSTINAINLELDNSDIVLGVRNDVINGILLKKIQAIYPLGFKSKSIICIDRLHSAIQAKENCVLSQKKFINYHLDIVLDNERYGKVGRYTNLEINRLKITKIFSYSFFRRFIIPIIFFLPRNIFDYNLKTLIYFFLKIISEFFVAAVLIINKKIFSSFKDQTENNNNYFYNNIYN
jgi:glycosyltransferase involved in cell wall biosynthesis